VNESRLDDARHVLSGNEVDYVPEQHTFVYNEIEETGEIGDEAVQSIEQSVPRRPCNIREQTRIVVP